MTMKPREELIVLFLGVLVPYGFSAIEDMYVKRMDCIDKVLQPDQNVQSLSNTESLIECASRCSSNQTCATFSLLVPDCRLSNALIDDVCSLTDEVMSAEIFQKAKFTCNNDGIYNFTVGYCICQGGYVGSNCERLATDCAEIGLYAYYPKTDFVVTIKPSQNQGPIEILCNNEFGVGRNVIQRHFDLGNTFYQQWDSYSNGFGDLLTTQREFWLGNNLIHLMTASGSYKLVIEMANEHWTSVWQQQYVGFKVGNSSTGYMMTYTSSSPTQGNSGLGDSLAAVNNTMFCTEDVNNNIDPNVNCGTFRESGFWFCDPYNKCGYANPNGALKKTADGLRLLIYPEVFWDGLGDVSPWFVQMWLE